MPSTVTYPRSARPEGHALSTVDCRRCPRAMVEICVTSAIVAEKRLIQEVERCFRERTGSVDSLVDSPVEYTAQSVPIVSCCRSFRGPSRSSPESRRAGPTTWPSAPTPERRGSSRALAPQRRRESVLPAPRQAGEQRRRPSSRTPRRVAAPAVARPAAVGCGIQPDRWSTPSLSGGYCCSQPSGRSAFPVRLDSSPVLRNGRWGHRGRAPRGLRPSFLDDDVRVVRGRVVSN